jgi:hypothetical protein
LRHPESKQELQKALIQTLPPAGDELFALMFGAPTPERKSEIELGILTLGPILSGFVLESYFEPEQLTDEKVERLLAKLFDALFSPHK